MIHTLTSLSSERQAIAPLEVNPSEPEPQSRQLQSRIDLVLRQYQLGLDINAIVVTDPQLKRLVDQMRGITPNLFVPQRKLTLQVDLSAPLDLPDQTEPVFIQATINVAFRHNIPKLFDWSIRRPTLSWQDRVRLWVATEHYHPMGLVPGMMRLIVVALSVNQPAQAVVFPWNRRQHAQTEAWLRAKVLGEDAIEPRKPEPMPLEPIELIDLAAIPEVAI